MHNAAKKNEYLLVAINVRVFFQGRKKTLFKNVHINVSVTKARPPYLSTPKQDWTSTLKKVSASVLEYQIKRPKWHLFIYLFIWQEKNC